MPYFPPLFLSHGAPNMTLHDSDVRSFMQGLAASFHKPKAIVVCSAHFETKGTSIVTDPSPEMIYDFRGFEPELREINYSAPGEPKLAAEITKLLYEHGISVQELSKRGFDHGVWVPLSLIWPNADIPIVQISIDPNESPEYHYNLGLALSSLPERNIAVIGTGNITHNLSALFNKGQDADLDANIKSYVDEFLAWFDAKLIMGDIGELLDYRENAPRAAENHPTDEHLLPIYVALGAAGKDFEAKKLHASFSFDFLAMDAWSFRDRSVA